MSVTFGNGTAQYVSSTIEAFNWASRCVKDHLHAEQPLINLMDGAPSQREAVNSPLKKGATGSLSASAS